MRIQDIMNTDKRRTLQQYLGKAPQHQGHHLIKLLFAMDVDLHKHAEDLELSAEESDHLVKKLEFHDTKANANIFTQLLHKFGLLGHCEWAGMAWYILQDGSILEVDEITISCMSHLPHHMPDGKISYILDTLKQHGLLKSS